MTVEEYNQKQQEDLQLEMRLKKIKELVKIVEKVQKELCELLNI